VQADKQKAIFLIIKTHLTFAYWLALVCRRGFGEAAILHNVTIRLFLSYSATLCNLALGCFFWHFVRLSAGLLFVKALCSSLFFSFDLKR
jgi:hypothetical protein